MRASAGQITPLSVLGFDAGDEDLYRILLRHSGASIEDLAATVGRVPHVLREDLARFVALGLVAIDAGVVVAEEPEWALGRLVTDEELRLQNAGEQLVALRGLLPSLTADHLAHQLPQGEQVHVEAVDMDDIVPLLKSLSALSTGELRWLRPDEWRFPVSREIDQFVAQLVEGGRDSRAIYPARVLAEAPDVVRYRAGAGENVRMLASVPTRLAILGDFAAVVPEQWGQRSARVLVVRQPALVSALQSLFEAMWDKALSVPGLSGDGSGAEAMTDRSLLLDQLAGGAKDEQIARALGISLRTVRRRVQAVLAELGVGSRFQAGVEAVRRGWL